MKNVPKELLLYLLLLAAGAAAYAPSFGGGFIWDDAQGIVENPLIKTWSGSISTFSPWYWLHNSAVRAPTYRPLLMLSYTADYSLFRLDPRGYRLTNFALHFAAAVLLLFFARRFFGPEAWEYAPFAAALLFMTYPRLMENVAWVKNRSDMLVVIFLLWGLILIHDGARRLGYKLTGLFLLAALTKETAAALPLVWTAYLEARPVLGGTPAGPLKKLRPLYSVYGVLAIYSALILALGGGGSISGVGPFSMVFAALKNLGAYTLLSLFPYGVDPVRNVPSSMMAVYAVVPAALVLLAAVRRSRPLLFLSLWFIAALLLPTLPLRSRPLADQRTYMACAGAVMLFTYALGTVAVKKRIWGLALIVILNIIVIGHNVKVYAENETFWKYAFLRNPNDDTVRFNLGGVYMTSGKMDKAAVLLESAARSAHVDAYADNDLGIIAQQSGKLEQAVEYFDRAVAADPAYFEPYLNRGGIYFLKGFHEKARSDWEKALELAPDRPEVYNNLGLYYARRGELADAKIMFYSAERIDPEFLEPRENLAVIHRKLGQYEMLNEELYRISQIKERRQVVSHEVAAD